LARLDEQVENKKKRDDLARQYALHRRKAHLKGRWNDPQWTIPFRSDPSSAGAGGSFTEK